MLFSNFPYKILSLVAIEYYLVAIEYYIWASACTILI